MPSTDDEVNGYWLFALGVVLGLLGIALLVTADLTSPVPQWPVVIVAVGLVLLVAGPIVRLPLDRRATRLVSLGALLSALAIPWFVSAYPGWRAQAPSIIGLYAIGLGVMAVGGVFVPLLTGRADEVAAAESRAAVASAGRDALAERLAESEGAREELAGNLDATDAELAAAQDAITAAQDSKATFELYEDSAGEWRWRLRHRNTNIVADSGQGYASRQKAEQGMRSVQRNAAGAAVSVQAIADDPAEFEPVLVQESQADFEVYEDDAGEWRWRLRHENGEIIGDGGEGYASKSNVERAIESVRALVSGAAYLDPDPAAFEVYADAAGEYRWRLRHRNGSLLADSGEGYVRRSDATDAVDRVRAYADGEDGASFEVYEDAAGEHRWRLVHENGNALADSGEGYASASASDAVDRVRDLAPDADALDVGNGVFDVYEDAAGEYRWRLVHRNGNVLADSGEGYTERNKAVDAVERIKRHAPGAGQATVDD